jgi:hypothetical protein
MSKPIDDICLELMIGEYSVNLYTIDDCGVSTPTVEVGLPGVDLIYFHMFRSKRLAVYTFLMYCWRAIFDKMG